MAAIWSPIYSILVPLYPHLMLFIAHNYKQSLFKPRAIHACYLAT